MKVLVDAVPDGSVEVAARKGIVRCACGDGDVGDDEPSVMGGQIFMDGVGKNPEVAVEEEDEEEGDDGGGGYLDDVADLCNRRVSLGWFWLVIF